ncbi:hypothetical protein KM043_013017 [Ampulex compressa]|nr:hypothetical protein KM043_013017 [Ampulex compressa]
MKVTSLNLNFLLILIMGFFILAPAFPQLCKFRGRQLTIGQTLTNCYANVTCHKNGVLEIKDSCPLYVCTGPSNMLGFKTFDSQKPYPECCSGPICEDGRVIFYHGASRSFSPKAYVKRSPHVMGIKFP